MKNTPRIQKNNATEPARKQATPKTRALKPLVEPQIQDGIFIGRELVQVVVSDIRLDMVYGLDINVAGCDLKRSEWNALLRKSKTTGVPIGRMLRLAIDRLLAEN